ncbi:hypothetical protein NDU88_002475 [Pleurodeles waltl]|uniref:Uncharacterized protein n=1 Tax=Pleurodeles waltl TaxID=8319 RepID=A0AAV7KVT5_PLEWA|nr:hypothetical protein NDU88_002475 [Pleurodeles waltl]
MREEPQRLELRGDTCIQEKDVNLDYGLEEQRRKEDTEGKPSAGENDKALLLDSAACHVGGGTWLAERRNINNFRVTLPIFFHLDDDEEISPVGTFLTAEVRT